MAKKGIQTSRKDDLVEQALYKRAKGHHAMVEKPIWNPKLGKHVVMRYREYYPPDSVAARFWLQNRRPNKWQADPQPDPQEDIFKRRFTFNIFERDLRPKNELAEEKLIEIRPNNEIKRLGSDYDDDDGSMKGN